jgi:hypothetical protein
MDLVKTATIGLAERIRDAFFRLCLSGPPA